MPHAAKTEQPKKRTLKKYPYRGIDLDKLLDMSNQEDEIGYSGYYVYMMDVGDEGAAGRSDWRLPAVPTALPSALGSRSSPIARCVDGFGQAGQFAA